MAATQHSSAMLALLDSADPTTTWLLAAACGLLLLLAVRRRTAPLKTVAEAELPELAFPMWVVPLRTMIELAKQHRKSGTLLPTHDELQEQGLLVRWQPGMNTMFLSHTWLGYEHPDPKGDKCRLLEALLEGILAGRTQVTGYWVASVVWSDWGISAKELTRKYSDGYVWMDYCSIPQRDRGDQGLAIDSVAGYVARAADFIVLSGAWKHEDGSVRDVRAWNERGWCRMEQFANAMSPVSKTVIVAESPTSVQSHGPWGVGFSNWMQSPVGEGTFTVESDKAKLGPSIRKLIEARKAQCDLDGDLGFYRFLCAATSKLLGGTDVDVKELPLDEWLAELRFSGPCDDEETTGLSPLRFAIIASRADLVAQLLERGANAECRTKQQPKGFGMKLFMKGTPLIVDCCMMGRNDPACLNLLLAHGANPRAIMANKPHGHALNAATFISNYHLFEPLLAADPTLWQVPHFNCFLPFEQALQSGTPECVRFVLDHYAEQLQGLPPGVPEFLDEDGHKGIGAAHTAEWMRRMGGVMLLWTAVNHRGDARVLKMVLDAGHDPNGDLSAKWTDPSKRRPPLKIWQGTCEILSDLSGVWWSCSGLTDKMGNWRCSPLHMSALTGNLGCVELLLAYGAKPESKMHSRGLTPLHLAAMGGHQGVVDALLKAAPPGVNLARIGDNKGYTPAYRAARRGHAEIAAQLETLEKEPPTPNARVLKRGSSYRI